MRETATTRLRYGYRNLSKSGLWLYALFSFAGAMLLPLAQTVDYKIVDLQKLLLFGTSGSSPITSSGGNLQLRKWNGHDSGGTVYNVKAYGAVGNTPYNNTRTSDPVENWCSNHGGTRYTVANDTACLAAIQANYVEVRSLTNEMDWAAVNAAIDASKVNGSYAGTIVLPNSTGCYAFDQPLQNGNGTILKGEGSPGTCINYYGSNYAIHTPVNINSYTIEDVDVYVTNSAGGGIEVGDNYRHILIKQVNITLASDSRGYGESNDDGGTHGGIDVTNEVVRVTGGYVGFYSESRSTSNQWLCINCYASGAGHIGFAFESGIDQTICIECAADSSGGYGYDLHPASDNFIHMIGSTCENSTLSCYLIDGRGGAVTLEHPTTYKDSSDPYDIASASGVDIVLMHPASVSTIGANSAECTSAKSLTVIGNTEFDKFPAASWTACLSPNIHGALQSVGYISKGKTFTSSAGCAETSLTGGATAGYFLAGATSCTTTITMGSSVTAPNGWACNVWDVTTTGDTLHETAYSSTTVTFSGTVATRDKIAFACQGF